MITAAAAAPAPAPAEDSPSLKSPSSDDVVRIKFLCSHGGKILPRPDGLLRYVGGDTRLVTFNKNIAFADLIQKLEKLFGSNLSLKYQLPNEDLDILISVTCDEDVQNLVEEYEKNEAREGASRLRAFLFPRSGVSSKHVHYQTTEGEEEDEVKSPGGNKIANITCSPRAMISAPTLSIPEVFEGSYSAYIPQNHLELDDQQSPHQAIATGSPMKSTVPYSTSGVQPNYSRNQPALGSVIDCVGRGPALTTSALGPLSSSQLQQQQVQMWEPRKAFEEGCRSDEKCRVGDLNADSYHHAFLQDAAMMKPMVRIPSNDSVLPSVTDSGTTCTQIMLEQQSKLQTVPRVDLPESLLDARLDSPVHGNNVRLYVPSEMSRIHNTSTALEMQWGLAQRTAFEKNIDNQRNGCDSEKSFRKLDIHSEPDDVIHNHHVMKHELTTLQQLRHAEYGFSNSLQSRHDHLHHLNRSQFQPIYWQLGDANQEQKQYHATISESVHMGTETHRHGQPFEIHAPPSGICACCQHTTGPPNMWTHPDAFSSARISSPLYRRAASGSPTSPQLHPDCTGPGRWPESAASPRKGQIPNVGSHVTAKHGIWAIQTQDIKPQHVSSQIFSDSVEGHQSGRQLEKGVMVNRDAMMNQAQYFDKIILVNQDGAVGQIQSNELMKRGCASSNQDAQAAPGQQYGRLISNQESQCGRTQ